MPESGLAVDRTMQNQLLGTWTLISVSSASSTAERDGTPYGINPSGYLTYGEDGRVTALISYGGRKILSPTATADDYAEAFKTFFAYAGRYTLNANQVVHHVEVSSIQNYVNRDLIRTVSFEGDRIALVTPPTLVNGKMQTVTLTWQRIPKND